MASDIEEPRWELLETLEAVEIRYYPAGIQATTRIPTSGHTTTGFRRLADYIFGANSNAKSIAMTAPVQETLESGSPTMAFFLPAEYSLDELPAPNDQRVEIVPVDSRTMAVVRFSGWATGPKVTRMQGKLLKTLETHGVSAIGVPVLNQYNPPWTVPFLRRNEVSVQVEWSEGRLAQR